jgi:tetratricopeptide (TPR) repeat protein
MPYSVAVDDAQNSNAIRWLGAFGQDIPKAFIIDQQGRVAWSGHPLADLDEVLSQVVAGTYDVQKEAKKQQFRIVAESQMREVFVPIQKALVIREPKQAVQAIDEAISKNATLETGLGPTKFQMLLRYDEASAYAYGKKLAEGPCKDSASALNLIAWSIVDDASKLKRPDVKAAVEIARRANELTNYQDAYMLDTLAYALYKSGDRPKALDLQIKAVTLAEKMKGIDPKIMQDLRDRLTLFKKSDTP